MAIAGRRAGGTGGSTGPQQRWPAAVASSGGAAAAGRLPADVSWQGSGWQVGAAASPDQVVARVKPHATSKAARDVTGAFYTRIPQTHF